jgi:AcrR family transcriptional regulator
VDTFPRSRSLYELSDPVVHVVVRGRFPISGLVERTGVPAASVHHYLRLGLLPRPDRSLANRFLYDERHVRALTLIRLLRERRRLPLDAIRKILPDLLELEGRQAFRPDMWDRVAGVRLQNSARRSPRARLLAAAMDAFARRGFADVNVDDICRAARIAKGSFYRHYRSKEDLFFAAADAARGEVAVAFGEALSAGPDVPGGAAEALARALEPRLPLFLDLFTRALQRRPGYQSEARRIFSMLAYEVGELLGAEEPVSGGAWLLGLSAAGAFRRALEPSPLAGVDFPGTAGA